MHCTLEATYVDSHRRFCDIHYRFNQMRQCAKAGKKYSPSRQELEDLIPEDLKCPECNVVMVWRRKRDQKGVNNQVTLQHWRDGSISLICLSCNTRHYSMPGDTYKEMQKDHKLCPSCKTIQHETNFCVKNSRSVLKRNSICNVCNRAKRQAWRINNPEKDKLKNKLYRINNPEKVKLIEKKYKEKNKEKAKIQHKIWRENNREKVNKKMAEYRKNNPEKIAQYREKARLKRIAEKNDLPE